MILFCWIVVFYSIACGVDFCDVCGAVWDWIWRWMGGACDALEVVFCIVVIFCRWVVVNEVVKSVIVDLLLCEPELPC